jgi:hypothetical protein
MLPNRFGNTSITFLASSKSERTGSEYNLVCFLVLEVPPIGFWQLDLRNNMENVVLAEKILKHFLPEQGKPVPISDL